MKKLIALLLALVLTGCAPAARVENTRTVIDHDGVEVTLPEKVERIVVCDILPLPSVLAVFFDSAEKIVGMSGTSMNAAEKGLLGELYPEILEAETGFIDGTTVNAEELMKLQPDVVFYNASRKELGQQLRKAGFPAVAISVNKWDYDCIETLNQWAALLGEIFPENDRREQGRKTEHEHVTKQDFLLQRLYKLGRLIEYGDYTEEERLELVRRFHRSTDRILAKAGLPPIYIANLLDHLVLSALCTEAPLAFMRQIFCRAPRKRRKKDGKK